MDTLDTHDDVIRLFPGIQDHASLEILSTRATVEEFEAELLLLQDNDDALVDIQQRHGDRLNVLLAMPATAEIQPLLNFDR